MPLDAEDEASVLTFYCLNHGIIRWRALMRRLAPILFTASWCREFTCHASAPVISPSRDPDSMDTE